MWRCSAALRARELTPLFFKELCRLKETGLVKKARGEGLGVECPPFGMERPHRVALTLLPLLACSFISTDQAGWVLQGACAAIAVGASLTAGARVAVIHRQLRGSEGP